MRIELTRGNGTSARYRNEESNMTTRRVARLALLTGAGLFSLSLATGAWAADVEKLVDSCSQCHERDGASHDPNMPIIGGYSEQYFISSVTAYKNKSRVCPAIEYLHGDKKVKLTDMCRIVKTLSDEDVRKLAGYYSTKKFRRANQDFDPELAKKGKQIHERDCEKCHSEGGSLASDDAGILAGQWTPYLKQQFFAFYTEKRTLAKKMKPKFNELAKTDMDALLNYYASFR
jgi:sulfide dehydrogenase cytochrome subunit